MFRGKLNLSRSACLALVAMIALLTGCGGGGGGSSSDTPPADTTPPEITNVTVTDTTANPGATSATYTISARVTDSSGVQRVNAVVTGPDNIPRTINMTGSVNYTGTWNVVRSPIKAEIYSVRITATDNAGNSTSSTPVEVSVTALDTPPPPPPF